MGHYLRSIQTSSLYQCREKHLSDLIKVDSTNLLKSFRFLDHVKAGELLIGHLRVDLDLLAEQIEGQLPLLGFLMALDQLLFTEKAIINIVEMMAFTPMAP